MMPKIKRDWDVKCPTCDAPPGRACETPKRYVVFAGHNMRIKAQTKHDREVANERKT